jgi:hypothetical protein
MLNSQPSIAAPVTKSVGALTFSAVISYISIIYPRTTILLCLHQLQPVTNLVYFSLAIRDMVQSSKYVYPLVLLVGGETKQHMERLST